MADLRCQVFGLVVNAHQPVRMKPVVFSARIADALKNEIDDEPAIDWNKGSIETDVHTINGDHPNMTALRKVMSESLGVLRNKQGMQDALLTILALEETSHSKRFTNVITTAKMIAVCALNRLESRGGHARTDMPDEDPSWKRRTLLTLEQAEAIIPELMKDYVES
ncbi:L-aspartate oxidase [Nymphon striatum]|nr:L-aspartate oxidase [Nymphon striatum]